jgi:hypothetical protein
MIAATLLMGACSKEDDAPATPDTGGSGTTPTSTSNPAPTFSDGSGVLWAINTITSQTVAGIPFEIEAGIGAAMFPETVGGSTFVNAGTVSLNGTNLAPQTNQAYVNTPDQANPTGIDFSSGETHWTVSGGNGIPSIDQSPGFGFPTVGALTSGTTITRSNGYTLSVANVSSCDSVVFMVGSVVKMRPSGTTSCDFTAGELGTLAAGPSLVQVSPYAYQAQTIGGKQYYFGKQTSRSVGITLQ